MNTYMVLLVDRKRAKMFTLLDGTVERYEEFTDGHVPQIVHPDEEHYYGREDKILRHINVHLHRHLNLIAKKVQSFARKEPLAGIVIGTHKPLLYKIDRYLPYNLSNLVKGRFIAELKEPINKTIKRAKRVIQTIETK